MAAEALDEKNLEVLIKSLSRASKNETAPQIDFAICVLDDDGTVADCSDSKAKDRVTAYLRKNGMRDSLSTEGFRKRVKRLQHIGVQLTRTKHR